MWRRSPTPLFRACRQVRLAWHVTELEVGYSARSSQDYAATRQDLLDLLIPVTMPLRVEERARERQRDLVTRGGTAE
jgi:hypothetical protein